MAVVTAPGLDPATVRIPPHPPPERGNLILQIATDQPRFDEVREDILIAQKHYGNKPQRIFLVGGRDLPLPIEKLLSVVTRGMNVFPQLERISIYRDARLLLTRNIDDLKLLKQAGLHKIYTRLETGDADLFQSLNMDMTAEEYVHLAEMMKTADVELSVTVRLGIAGAGNWIQNATRTAMILNQMQVPEIRLHHLIVRPDSPFQEKIASGAFTEASRHEILREMYELVRLITYPTRIQTHRLMLRGLPIERKLPEEQDKMLKILAFALSYFYGDDITPDETVGYSVADILKWDGYRDVSVSSFDIEAN
jgi:radical SAM superfamily enzyme YgiQ (UPF0313 family)